MDHRTDFHETRTLLLRNTANFRPRFTQSVPEKWQYGVHLLS